ncbi:hypothetical protein FRC18_005700 [Serendipita sp. 400]|nr:hypothetical protein FRC18_005700 [Serendipita sp. 400]
MAPYSLDPTMFRRRPFEPVTHRTTDSNFLLLRASKHLESHGSEIVAPKLSTCQASKRRSGKKPKRILRVSRRDSPIKESQSCIVRANLEEATRKLTICLEHGLAPSTKRNYNNAIKRYLRFAASIGIQEDSALPCSRKTLSLFLCDGLGRTGPGYAKASLRAIRSWHVDNGYEWTDLETFPRICRALAAYWPRNQQ